MIHYLEAGDVLRLHHALVEFFAEEDPIEPSGPRDSNLLASACTRPQTSLGGVEKYASVEAKAAALFHSLVKNHPFHNGNKRTALVAAIVFLDKNKRRLRVDVGDDEIFELVTRVAADAFPEPEHTLDDDGVLKEIAGWFGRSAIARDPNPKAMRTVDFLEKCVQAGGNYREAEGGWVVLGTNAASIRIAGSTRKLDGQAIKKYVSKLGFSGPRVGVYIDEFQAGVPSDQVTFLRLRNVLRRLANA